MSTVAPGVRRLGSPYVNWYLVEDGGRLTAVDAGLPAFAAHLKTDLAALGCSVGAVEAVVLTHSDGDHTGVARALQRAGARVLIHEQEEGALRKPRPKISEVNPLRVAPQLWRPALWRLGAHVLRGGGALPARIEGAETFADGDVLDVPGRPRVVHTPGHTRGHSAFLLESNGALFVGDALCTWNPMTARRGPQVMPSAFNVSTHGCFESLAAIESLDARVLLPGHGDPWWGRAAAAVARARAAGRS
jgi:glyoxylase-like metal-dependent hydrolase (beta-lactamase superfamily II)